MPRSLFLLLLLPLTACHQAIVSSPNPIPIAPQEYDRVFSAAQLVLAEKGFILNRIDYQYGVITTRPFGSHSIFEPWRNDNTTGYQKLESTLQQQRRIVTITLEPAQTASTSDAPTPNPEKSPPTTRPADSPTETQTQKIEIPARYLLRVEVLLERLESPAEHMTGSSSGRYIVGGLSDTPIEYQERGLANSFWLPIGRDPYLEQKLVDWVLRRSITLPQPPATTQPAAAP